MSSQANVAKEIASLITGILLLFAACGTYMKMKAHAVLVREADREADLRGADASSAETGEAAADTLETEEQHGKEGREDDE